MHIPRSRLEVGKGFFLDGDDRHVVSETTSPCSTRKGNRPLPAMRPILLMPEEKDLIILASLGRRRHSRLPWSNLPTRVETTSGVRRPDGRLRRIIKVRRAEQPLLK